ncbi:SDR family oxidoreductase [Candidatus Micrarchaeota archaeon]|nr:SDR family oxidoreductase [Candidatus Micrarchaeota archaeon]
MNKKALITGPTSGIGYELARIFANNGFDLILVGRNREKLEKVASELKNTETNCDIIVSDLVGKEAAIGVFEETRKKRLDVDILVNNAGFGLYGEFSKTDIDKEIEMIELNIVTLTTLTKLFLPQMIARKSGKILNLASTAAFQPGPLMAVYYATKAYVLHFSEAIAEELKETGVSVTALCPGPTETGFQKEAKMDNSVEVLRKENVMDAKTVAKVGYDALISRKVIAVAGLKNKITAELVRIAPRSIVRKIVKKIQESKTEK